MKCILPAPLVRLVDDDNDFRESQKAFLTALGWQVEDWESPAAFLQDDDLQRPGCAVLDIRMPGMSGLELQERMKAQNLSLPIIFVTGHGDVPTAVRTLKLGAFDFLEKPVDAEALADAIEAASRVSVEASRGALPKQAVEQILAEMSPREHEITELLKQGLANHDIAERLDLSDRTVQGHRNNIYKKLRVHNLKQFLTVLEGG